MPHAHLDLDKPTGDTVKTTTCYMCACRCGIRVHLKDGRVRYIDGNPKHPVNRGVICAKGSAGIMQHYSPARLSRPLLRVGERGAGEFREIEWDEALSLAAQWLGDIRARNPDELAFFSGRDQSQALTGWWAQAFGTINYAAHGGFCSVNMAAAGMYTFGGSFWEFGEPDWALTKFLMLWGVAEDHDSNPIKLGLGALKKRGAKIVVVNPVRTGYGAIADEWVAINPGTDGLLAGALIHELLRADRIDLDYLVRFTNAHHLVIRAPGEADDGMIARDAEGRPLCATRFGHPGAGRDPAFDPDQEQRLDPGRRRDDGDDIGSSDENVKGAANRQDRRCRESANLAPLPEPTAKALDPGFSGDDEEDGSRSPPSYAINDASLADIAPLVVGEYALADGRTAVPAFHLFAERYLADDYSPECVASTCGIDVDTIRRLARELADVAFDQSIRIPQKWTDTHGREHAEMIGRPVSMHAMRGISAHANGFHTCRTLHLLQMLLGAIDTPGSFRYQPPYPKPAPPGNRPGKTRKPNGALDAGPLGYVHTPDDLVVDADGHPRRIDKAFSWEHPFAAHGMLQNVIRNAWAGDPYRIDTLFLFMANMGWNSAMNTTATREMLTARDANGEYRIPRIIYADAYSSETVAFADLVLPDTTYLERYDCISLIDRPISDADGAADAIRHPVVAPDRDVRPFQDVLLDLGARLKLPGLVDDDGAARYPHGYAQYIAAHERTPGVGLLAGWRGADGDVDGIGAPNPDQVARYIEHGSYWHRDVPLAGRYYKMANRDYLDWAKSLGFVASTAPITMQFYAETLQRFRLAAQGHGTHQPPDTDRARVERFFDPLPFWYASLDANHDASRETVRCSAPPTAEDGRQEQPAPQALHGAYPLAAITQRPMFMYHAWGSQNRWLRQIATRNALYVHPDTAREHGIADGDWVWLHSPRGRIRVEARTHRATARGTVWTWNAIGKRKGAWKLGSAAPEFHDGFILNHLIDDSCDVDGMRRANADPVTGQAAWFDLRVRIERDDDSQAPGHRVDVEGAGSA